MRLRSLHLDAGHSWRGGQRQVLLLSRALRDRGDEPLVIGVPDSPLVERAHAQGIATAAIRMRNDWDLRAAKRIRSIIRTWRPHIVHAHDARAHALALIALTGNLAPLVVTRRVTFPLKSVRFKYGPRVTRFIAISNAVKQAMVASGVDGSRIDVVHSGVPTPIVTAPRAWRQELGWRSDTVLVGIVGAMTAEKGTHVLADIARNLPMDVAHRTKLVFLGGTERGGVELGLVEGYRAGFVTDIYNAMAGLDLLWHPAASEGLGTAVIDSLALGVPPIAFDVGGLGEVVENGRQGILVPYGDVQAFAQAHERLMDPNARAELGMAGPERAEHFSVDRMTEMTARVYQTLLTA